MDVRVIDPTRCWVRHVRRGVATDPTAFVIGQGYLVRADVVSGADGVNGRQGWQQAEITAVLSDDGTFTLTLPNTAGDDGVLHRRRFRILTDDFYEPGEEWLEFWTDADPVNPLFVGTPTDYGKTTSEVTIKGRNLTAALEGSYSSDVDAWDAAAPADVLRHYSRLAVLIAGADSGLGALTGAAGAWSTDYTQALTGVATDSWTAAVDLRWTSARPAAAGAGQVRMVIAGVTLAVDVFDGAVTLTGAPERPVTGKRVGLAVPGPVGLRIVARYDRIFAFVAGELVAEFRRPAPWPAVPTVTAAAYGGTASIDRVHVDSVAPFAGRGASAVIDRALPGIPPATGLRGQLWSAGAAYAQNATRDGRLARLWTLGGEADPAVDRVEPTLALTGAPQGIPGAYAARWSGAIYLDLAAADRKVRLTGLVGNARVYIGRTLRGDEAATSWASVEGTTPITTGGLRAWLGTSAAGWYPIVVEQAHSANVLGITLEDTALDGAGAAIAWATVPTARLSPIGVYSDLVRNETHRSVWGDVASTFGYQWRVEPRSVESGEFPGALVAAAIVGRMTEVVVDDDATGTDVEVEGNAGDVIDGLLADGAGIADPAGAGQLFVQTVDYPRALGHLAFRQGFESLSEISEQPLLATRADSILALRSSTNEQVGVRPRGQRDLVDTFPLAGSLARMDWRPGDGVRLSLDSVDVVDASPRQMTTVTWKPVPDGLGAPTVGFRQRPRTFRSALRRLTRAIYGPRRNYQGGFAIAVGTPGATSTTLAPDGYSRAPLPANLDDVARVVVVARAVATSAAAWRIEVGGVDLGADGTVPTVGRYDVTRAAVAAAAGTPQLSARLIGGTGSYEITVEVWVRV